MLETYMTAILIVTGTATASMFLQFLTPKIALKAFNGLDVSDELTLFFARAAGLAVTSLGALLIWAGFVPALRTPVLLIAVLGKTLFVATILRNWSVVGRGFALTAAFDSVCVALYTAYLLNL